MLPGGDCPVTDRAADAGSVALHQCLDLTEVAKLILSTSGLQESHPIRSVMEGQRSFLSFFGKQKRKRRFWPGDFPAHHGSSRHARRLPGIVAESVGSTSAVTYGDDAREPKLCEPEGLNNVA